LYQGDYLPDALYEAWAAEERERLATLFLETADRLADMLIGPSAMPKQSSYASASWLRITAGSAPTAT
jgi:two-component SAPR family response regulator